MKTNLEKIKKVSKSANPPVEVSPGVVVVKMNEGKPRQGRKLVSEKGPSEAKPRRSRKKVGEEPVPELPYLDMRPLDEQEDLDHTKKGKMSNKQWKTPENIPVEQPSIDDMTLSELIAQPEDEGEFLIKEFGTKDPETIDRITTERLQSGDYEQVIIGNTKGINGKEFKSAPKINPEYGTYIPPSKYSDITEEMIDREHAAMESELMLPHSPIDTFQEHQHEKSHIEKSERNQNKRMENLKTLSDSKKERASRGILGKIKNFWVELKNDTKSIAEELGWDEEKELEKQAQEYQAHLKETEKTINEVRKEIEEAKDYDNWEKAA